MKRFILAFTFFAVLIAIWELLVRTGVWNEVFVPSPLDVGRYFITSFQDKTLLESSWVTVKRLLLGYIVGLGLGVPLGMLNSRFKFAEDTVGLIALGLQTLPSVCWAPLALLWFGQTEIAMFFIVIMGSVWSILLATDAGVRSVPPIYVRAARTMGSKGLHTWIKVIVPASLPFVVSGMKQGWAFAWRSLMAAEIYITILTGFGLGHLLHYGRELHAIDAVVGIMIIIVVIGLLTDKIVFSPMENWMHRRWGTRKA
jgi:NitT/TauT family transport system permease protein